MAQTLLVSILIPAYNAAPFIAQTLESVLAQTLTDWKCIIATNPFSTKYRTLSNTVNISARQADKLNEVMNAHRHTTHYSPRDIFIAPPDSLSDMA